MSLPLDNWSALGLVLLVVAAPAAIIVALLTSRRVRELFRRR